MLHPLHSRYVPDPSKQAVSDLSWSFLRILHVQWTQGELGSSVVIFLHSLRILVWQSNVHAALLLQRLDFGVEAYVETTHIEWKICYTVSDVNYLYISLSCYYCINITFITISDHRLCGCLFNPSVFVCVYMLHVFTSYLMNNLLGMMCLVSWWLVLVQTDAQIGNSVPLLPSGIQGLLPSTSPYDIIDDGPTSVNFKGMENTTGLSYGLPPILDDEALPCCSCSFCQGD